MTDWIETKLLGSKANSIATKTWVTYVSKCWETWSAIQYFVEDHLHVKPCAQCSVLELQWWINMQNLRHCENSFNFFIRRFNQYNGGGGDGMWCPDTEIMKVFMYIPSSLNKQMGHQPFFSLLILVRMERMGRQSSSEICSGSPGMLGTTCSNCPISTPSITPRSWDKVLGLQRTTVSSHSFT